MSTADPRGLPLAGRVALVSGAAGRIGRVIVQHLRDEGAMIAAVDRNVAGRDGLRRELESKAAAKVVTLTADVSDLDSVTQLVTEAEAALGQMDILVNCAGLSLNCLVVDMSVDEWDRAFAINARSVMLMCRAYARQWIARGVPGSIVNVSSGAATSARAGGAHYAGAKAAVNMLTETLAIELGPHGIRANAVAPGVVLDHVLTEERPDQHDYINMMWRGTPLRRTGTPLDVAKAVAFLAGDGAAWISGVVLPVSGGSHAGRTNVPPTRDEKLA